MIQSNLTDTIAAIATPPAQGGIAVIRISGSRAAEISEKIFRPANENRKVSEMKGYTACFGEIITTGDNKKIDEGILTVFLAPHSYTGENTAEISCHGGLFVSRQVLRSAVSAGARLAEAGEFTKRAYLNNKLSLTQAESVTEIIYARSKQFLAGANALKEGALHERLNRISETLLDVSAKISACLDYPDDGVPDFDAAENKTVMERCLYELDSLVKSYDTGRILREGVLTAIVGKPNVGKSSVMNVLTGTKRSIVSDIAGTTRDIVEETVNLDGIVLRLSDCAGLRGETSDVIEKIGIDNMYERINSAEFILAVFDVSQPLDSDDYTLIEKIKNIPALCVINKNDLPQVPETKELLQKNFEQVIIFSAKQENALTVLSEKIHTALNINRIDYSAGFIANERQFSCAARAKLALDNAVFAVTDDISACGVMLEETLSALYELSGKNVSESVIDEVFKKFCVGK
jgi:tRNA modification GTPase